MGPRCAAKRSHHTTELTEEVVLERGQQKTVPEWGHERPETDTQTDTQTDQEIEKMRERERERTGSKLTKNWYTYSSEMATQMV